MDGGGDDDPAVESKLIASIIADKLTEVKDLLLAGANPNAGDIRISPDGRHIPLFPLQVAAERNNIDIVKVLIKQGAELSKWYPGRNGETALSIAITRNHREVALLLVDANIELLNYPSENGETPVRTAVRHGRHRLLRTLLLLGADPNGAVNGVTPLHMAAFGAYDLDVRKCFYVLLNNGANQADRHPRTQKTVLHEAVSISAKFKDTPAAKAGYIEMCVALLSGQLPTITPPDGHPHTWEGKFIVPSNPNNTNEGGITPLFQAVSDGSDELVRILLKYAANPNIICGDEGETALWVATLKGSAHIVELLKAYGAHPVNIETWFNDLTL
jgi:ankyrin repeat protein